MLKSERWTTTDGVCFRKHFVVVEPPQDDDVLIPFLCLLFSYIQCIILEL